MGWTSKILYNNEMFIFEWVSQKRVSTVYAWKFVLIRVYELTFGSLLFIFTNRSYN